MPFICGSGFKNGIQEIEQAAFRVGNCLRVALEIDGRNGCAVLVGLMRKAVHVRGTEREIFAEDEIRVCVPAADGRVPGCFDCHKN